MNSSPTKGSGHAGYKSPKKNDRIQFLDFPVAKLRSPVKRSMLELNKMAYANAVRNRHVISDETDFVSESENMIIAKIIKLSKLDGLSPLQLEEEEIESVEELEEKIIKKRKIKLEHQESPKYRSPTKLDSVSPIKLENGGEIVASIEPTPTNTPSKKIKTESDNIFTSPLRRSPRKKISVLDKLESVSNESSPRSSRKNARNLHSKFNKVDILIPKLHKNIKLMAAPEIDTNDDSLLQTDPSLKQKVLFHDGYEAYFEHNQTRGRISKSSMTMAPEMTYEEFNRYNKLLDLICTEPIKSVNNLYEFQFSQWLFELQEGFNLIFYGIGSKRNLLHKFLRDFILPLDRRAKCIVINGYNSEFNLRMLMREIWNVCFKKSLPASRETPETCNFTHVEFMKPKNRNRKLYILLNNIDGDSLRNDDLQYMLSEIARIKQVSLICSMDNLNTPVFWDASVLSNFNFIWHNTSTFQSYFTEVSFKDPLSIGKTDELVGSRGAKYVLSSLTGNAKNLYKNLILQQLEKIDMYIGDDTKLLENRGNIRGSVKSCISLREFYELCVSEFIISNDISFRTILGEFVEHKMCNLTRDTAGTEILYIQFTVDEIEKLLDEELMD